MNGNHHWDGRPVFTQPGWGFDGVGEVPPPGVAAVPGGPMFRMPAPGGMGMGIGVANGGPWGAPSWGGPPPGVQGPAWGVPLQQQGNFHMMQMQQPAQQSVQQPVQQMMRANPEMVTGPGAEREAVSSRGLDVGRNRDEVVQRAEKAARQAYEELVGEEKHISVTKLSQRTLAALGISSFELLGFRMQDVPCLRNLALVESKVNANIHAHIAAKRITTLHDLGCELTQEEGVSKFEDLGIGPLLLHPLVVRYFTPPDEVLPITTDEVMQNLADYIGDSNYNRVELDDFMGHLQRIHKAPTRLHLGVRIQTLGLHVGAVLRAKRAEEQFIKNWEALAKTRTTLKTTSVVARVSDFLSSQKQQNEGLKRKRNHIYFHSDDEDETERPSKVCPGQDRQAKMAKIKELFEQLDSANKMKDAVKNMAYSTERVGTVTGPPTCPYPSAAEERLRAKKQTQLKIDLENERREACVMSWSEVMEFVTVLKHAGKNSTVLQVLKHLVDFPWLDNNHNTKKTKVLKLLKSKPAIGLLYVAVLSIRMGLFDSTYDVLEDTALQQQEETLAAQTIAATEPITIDCKPSAPLETKVTNDNPEGSDLKTEVVSKCRTCNSPKVPLHRVQAFITQVTHASNDSSSPVDLERRLCKYFIVKKFEDLGLGSLESVLEGCNHGGKTVQSSNSVYYLGALIPADESTPLLNSSVSSSEMDTSVRVGSLGPKTDTDAIKALMNAPMLVNLSEWSQWDTIFAPTLGPLLSWLERDGSNGNICTLLTDSGIILKVDGAATVDNFLPSLMSENPKAVAVHLVSIVVLYGGVNHAPSALLKTYATKALNVLLFSFDGEPHIEVNTKVATFLLDILCALAQELQLFAAKILLPAFSAVVEHSSSILIKSCKVDEHHRLLHMLGLSLGIEEWINDFKACVLTPRTEEKGTQVLSSHETSREISSHESVLEIQQKLPTESIKEVELTAAKVSPEALDKSGKLVNLQTESLVMETDSRFGDIGNDQASRSTVVIEPVDLALGSTGLDLSQRSREVVEAIRRDEFGIGQDLKIQEQDLLARQHARMGRALHRLSQDLYSQDSHFVLELVQNADDNSYGPGVEAALVFIVQCGHVMVFNNEDGFTPANLRALCDVGNSTKAGSSTGYIGHKGIGFKSVFRVTDSPEIHSNGFDVKFDITESNLGFILPTIIEPRQGVNSHSDILKLVAEKVGSQQQAVRWNTRIDLPIKASISNGKGMTSLAAKFDDIHPSLLLFLHRLRCIAVQNDVVSATKLMYREDLADGLVRVVHDKGHATWLVVRQQVLAGVPRPGILDTEIALAFPLLDHTGENYKASSEQQQVFAFLPLRSYGLRFIVQSDFILPSSREEVDSDSAWNQWLRSEIPEVFVKAVETFKSLPSLGSRGAAVSNYLKFVPLEGEVLGFFSALPRLIHARLQATPCLPVEGIGSDWSFPCAVLSGWNEVVRKLIPDPLLKEHLGLQYLDKEVEMSDPLARSLGVQKYGSKTLVAFMKSLLQKSNRVGVLELGWIRDWLVALHDCLLSEQQVSKYANDSESGNSLVQELQALKFIPLAGGSFTAIEDGSVWFANHGAESNDGASKSLVCFPLLYGELRTVHPALFQTSAPEDDVTDDLNVRSKVVSMLHQLGIRPMSAHHVLRSHVLPAMADENCMARDIPLLVQYLGYAKWHLESGCNQCTSDGPLILKELKLNAVISTNNGLLRGGNEEPIHFGKSMGSPFDAQEVLDGCSMKWNEVDESYLHLPLPGQGSPNVESWRKFLGEIGVTDFVQVFPVEKTINDKGASLWNDENWEGVSDDTRCVIEDWECPELVELISSVSALPKITGRKVPKKTKRFYVILSILDKLWPSKYASCWRATYRTSIEKKDAKEGSTFASWVLQVRKLEWIKSSLDNRLHAPTSLFQRCESVSKVLGNHAAYARTQIQNVDLMKAFGFRTEVAVEDCLSLLQHWGSSCQAFEASVAQMSRLYLFLAEHANTKTVRKAFKAQPSIFVPSTSSNAREDILEGSLLSLDSVFWDDSTGALDMLHSLHASSSGIKSSLAHGLKSCNNVKALSVFYPELRIFFVEQSLVREKPDFYGYINILKQLAALTTPSSVLNQVLEVLAALCCELDSGKLTETELQEWKARLQETDCTVLPTTRDQWVTLGNDAGFVCVCDDERIGKEFAENSERLNFLCVSAPQSSATSSKSNSEERCNRVKRLYKSLGIPLLSQAMKREVIAYGSHDAAKIEALVAWALPYAQRYIMQHHVDIYNSLDGKRIRKLLKKLRFVVVDQLYFRYSLQSGQIHSSGRTECGCLFEDNTLHVLAARCEDHCMIYTELSRLFFSGQVNQQLANFLHLITMMASLGSQEADVELYMVNTQGVQPLSVGVAPWKLKQRLQESNLAMTASPVKGKSSLAEVYLKRHAKEEELMPFKKKSSQSYSGWPPRSWVPLPTVKSTAKSSIVVKADSGPLVSGSVLDRTTAATFTEEFHSSPLSTSPSASSWWTTGTDVGLLTDNPDSRTAGATSSGRAFQYPLARDQPVMSSGTEQQQITGRTGEEVAYQYLVKKYGDKHVKWVNEDGETGAPFDMTVQNESGKQEFVEVKTTRSQDKDWFEISAREWEFAQIHGDLYTVLRVILPSAEKSFQIIRFSNPVKLCRDRVIQLALILPFNHTLGAPGTSSPQGMQVATYKVTMP
ncbi:hypothetical protein KC19_6G104700 [Ceratodon purpureus]|uniref:Protein NO VEIN C-terminal domain-containing protein n=2 Tax=Ceratodon purpureus TaxID=3225 RepID=A0A8T0HG90_CERPU|nr:hypothetical protein KC19_6G104700 [Ceratodon purpureus]